ncbi:MAG TPA: quinone oxidoreductase [Candidatus Obscuribacterales bacterium]
MKAILVERHGDPDVLHLQEVKEEEPQANQVKVSLKAVGVNFIDVYERRGTYPVALPYVPGREASGVVESVGANVSEFRPGDRVAYTGQLKAYAEKAIVDKDKLIALPDELTFEQGAAFPLQGMTAHYLIHEYRHIKAGEYVLIHAAAGGMGLLLTQWASHFGAVVIGTVSSQEKAEAARQAGAKHTINYTEQDFVQETNRITGGIGAHLIIDGVGKTTFKGDLEACATRGNIVIFGSASGPAEPILPNSLQPRSLTLSGGRLNNYMLTREETLRRANDVLKGLKEGWLKLRIDHVLSLSDAAKAHRLLENRRTMGKVVLKVD